MNETIHHLRNDRWEQALPWLLMLLGLLLYVPSLSAPFVYDDKPHILDNPAIRGFDRWADFWARDRRILVWATLAVNYAIDGDNPRGYHLFNILIHALAAATLYGIVRRTLLLPALRGRYGRSASVSAFVMAFLWMAHPLATQAVAYVIQRAESMMGLFYLLTLYAMIRGDAGKRFWYALAVLACLLGMASKEVMVTAPALVLLYDRTFLAGSFMGAMRRRGVVYLLLIACWGYLAMTKIGSIIAPDASTPGSSVVGFATEGVTPLNYLATQSAVILHYLRLTFWPHPLVFDYLWPPAQRVTDHWPQSLVVMALLAASLWGMALRAPWRWAGFLGAWFFIILAPTSSFVPIRHMAFEHRMYLPLVGVVGLAVFGGHELLRHRRGAATAVALLAAVALSIRTVVRLHDYRSDAALWKTVLDAQPRHADAHVNYGLALYEAGDLDGAMQHYQQALDLRPSYLEAVLNMGVVHFDRGDLDQAHRWYEAAHVMAPADAGAVYNLGKIAFARGDLPAAEVQLRQTIELNRQHVLARDLLGVVLASTGRFDEAAAVLREAIDLDPGFVNTHNNLGMVYMQQERYADAVRYLNRAVALRPDEPTAWHNLGLALLGDDKAREAIVALERAAALSGRHPRVLDVLASGYARVGRIDEAAHTQQEAIAMLRRAGADADAIAPFEQRLRTYLQPRP